MSHILTALWSTLELWNTQKLITVTNASIGIKKKKEKKGEKKKISFSLDNTEVRIQNSHKHFLFSPSKSLFATKDFRRAVI